MTLILHFEGILSFYIMRCNLWCNGAWMMSTYALPTYTNIYHDID